MLPDDILTRSYIVLAYYGGWIEELTAGEFDRPSQFAIVATEDRTVVRITPTARIGGRPQEPFTVELDRGEVFCAQSAMKIQQDVSGSEIQATRPVAVFAGTGRASIPLRLGTNRDVLIEQIPPVESWGREAVVTPHYGIEPRTAELPVVRVIAANDGTRWWIDGVEQPPLRKGVPFERTYVDALHVTADLPILVGQYEHSTVPTQSSPFGLGDPFMMIVPPTEQFDTSYTFQAVPHMSFVDTAHFVNVVMPTDAIPSLRIDGAPVSASWVATPKPGYSFAQIRIERGSHTARADVPFGIYSYGFGHAISYGYTGGMLYRVLEHDFTPPGIDQVLACLGLDGVVTEAQVTDSGIDTVVVLPVTRNMLVTIEPFERAADTVRFGARLVDPFADGVVSILARDTLGRSRVATTPVAGFTVRAAGADAAVPARYDTLWLTARLDSCTSYELQNDGTFPQRVAEVRVVSPNDGVRVTTPMPLTIEPGARATIDVCVRVEGDTTAELAIAIVGDCAERLVIGRPIAASADSTAPRIATRAGECPGEVAVRIDDVGRRPSGVRRIELRSLVNARLREQPSLPSNGVELTLDPIDPFRDVHFDIVVTDGVGNEAVHRDTIGGFTLAVLDARRDSISHRFGREQTIAGLRAGDRRRDSVRLHNFGARTLHVTGLRMQGNRCYSVPPAQAPLVIPPGEDRLVALYVETDGPGQYADTLWITDRCDRRDAVTLRAVVTAIVLVDACESELVVESSGGARRTFLSSVLPNPVRGSSATIDIGLELDADVIVDLLDPSGEVAAPLLAPTTLGAGLHRLELDLSTVPDGAYLCRLRTSRGEVRVGKLVVVR